MLGLWTIRAQLLPDDLQARRLVPGRMGIEEPVTPQQFRVGDYGLLRYAHEHMEMVGEDGVGEDLDPAVFGHLPELPAQDLLGRTVEKPCSGHRPAQAMVYGLAGLRRHLDPRLSQATCQCYHLFHSVNAAVSSFSTCPLFSPRADAYARMAPIVTSQSAPSRTRPKAPDRTLTNKLVWYHSQIDWRGQSYRLPRFPGRTRSAHSFLGFAAWASSTNL